MLFLCLCLPFSISVFMRPGLGMQFLSEPLLVLIGLLFFFKIFGEKSGVKDLLLCPNWVCSMQKTTVSTILLYLPYWIWAYLIWLFVSASFSPLPWIGFKSAIAHSVFIIPAFFVSISLFRENLFSKKNKTEKFVQKTNRFFDSSCLAQKMLLCLVFSSALVASYTIIHYIFLLPLSIDKIFYISQPFFNDHTQLAAWLSMMLPVSIFFSFYYSGRKWVKIFCIIAVFLILFGIIISHCRASWLSLFIAGVLFLASQWKLSRKKWIGISVVSLLLLFLVLKPVLQWGERVGASKSNNPITNLLSLTNWSKDVSSMERCNRWKCAYRICKDFPISGSGIGTYSFLYGPYQKEAEITEISTYKGDAGNAHSEYFTALSETGIIGAGIFLCMTFVGFLLGYRAYKKQSKPSMQKYILTILLSLTTYFSHALVNNFLDTDKLAFIVFFFLSILFFEYQKSQMEIEK